MTPAQRAFRRYFSQWSAPGEFRTFPPALNDWADLVLPVHFFSDGSILIELHPYKPPTHGLHMGAEPAPSDPTSFLDMFSALTAAAH